jgi:hypothetical protein
MVTPKRKPKTPEPSKEAITLGMILAVDVPLSKLIAAKMWPGLAVKIRRYLADFYTESKIIQDARKEVLSKLKAKPNPDGSMLLQGNDKKLWDKFVADYFNIESKLKPIDLTLDELIDGLDKEASLTPQDFMILERFFLKERPAKK